MTAREIINLVVGITMFLAFITGMYLMFYTDTFTGVKIGFYMALVSYLILLVGVSIRYLKNY